MKVIGLTGGIGSGKTLTTDTLANLGVTVIDADAIAKTLTHADTPCAQAIIEHFGPTIAKPNGELYRDQLAHIVFNDPEQRAWLEQLLHPAIRKAMALAIDQLENSIPYCICSIPLLAENWPHPLVDEVVVVEADAETRLMRICQRDRLSPEAAQLRMSTQASSLSRRAIANHIIENNDSMQALQAAITKWHYEKLNQLNHNFK